MKTASAYSVRHSLRAVLCRDTTEYIAGQGWSDATCRS